jgi:hypothetical protein
LVTKLLPAGDKETIKQVHAAVGPTFLPRLLLPLHASAPAPQPAPPDFVAAAQQQQQQAAQCGLGLAVLAGFARVPELAGGEDVLEKLPLLLKVVRGGGLSPVLAARWRQQAPTAAQPAADPAADAAAVQDALECAVAAARSGAEGLAVAADCGALPAAAAVLQAGGPGGGEALSLALQLAAAVLADEGQRRRLLAGGFRCRAAPPPPLIAASLPHLPASACPGLACLSSLACLVLPAGNQEDLALLLPALARVFALPADHLAAGGGGGQREDAAAQQQQRQLLAVQLEALHVLLLLLPLPPGHALPQPLLAPGAAWPGALRRGLALLLRGRVAAVQRHSALQLAAAALDLLGPEWLLGGERDANGGGGAGQPSFFQLLVEVAKVETSVLLHDALAPGVPVPLAAAPAAAARDWRPPAPRSAAAGSDAGGSEAGDSVPDAAGAQLAADLASGEEGGGGTAADVEPLVRVLHSEQDRRRLQAQLEGEAAAAAAERPQPGDHMRAVDGTAIPSGGRRPLAAPAVAAGGAQHGGMAACRLGPPAGSMRPLPAAAFDALARLSTTLPLLLIAHRTLSTAPTRHPPPATPGCRHALGGAQRGFGAAGRPPPALLLRAAGGGHGGAGAGHAGGRGGGGRGGGTGRRGTQRAGDRR